MIPGLFIGLVLGLIFIEPDRGTTILMGGGAGRDAPGGRRALEIHRAAVCAGGGAVGLVISLLRDPMRHAADSRLAASGEQHKMDVGYQADHAMLALGSGGWTGLGLGNSRQKLGFLPEHTTDFIFSIIGEELGLIATLLVVARVHFVLVGDFRHLHCLAFAATRSACCWARG